MVKWRSMTYLGRVCPQRSPIQAGQHVKQHLLIQLNFVLHELSVLGVQRVRGGGGLARLDGARQEVKAEDLHFQ